MAVSAARPSISAELDPKTPARPAAPPYGGAMWILACAVLLFLSGMGLIGLNLFVLAGSLSLSFAGLLPVVASVALLLGAASL